MKALPRWIKIAWLICIPAGILVALVVSPLISNAPERDKALAFAQANDAVHALFGKDAEVTDHSDYPSSISFHGDGVRRGKHCFRVSGSQGAGKIVVHWESQRERDEFEVRSIVHYVADGEKDKTIWQSQ